MRLVAARLVLHGGQLVEAGPDQLAVAAGGLVAVGVVAVADAARLAHLVRARAVVGIAADPGLEGDVAELVVGEALGHLHRLARMLPHLGRGDAVQLVVGEALLAVDGEVDPLGQVGEAVVAEGEVLHRRVGLGVERPDLLDEAAGRIVA